MVIQFTLLLGQESVVPSVFSRIDLWMDAIDFGAVLVVDEIEASMHPLITRHLIEMIQNQTINQKNVIKKNYEKSKMAYLHSNYNKYIESFGCLESI